MQNEHKDCWFFYPRVISNLISVCRQYGVKIPSCWPSHMREMSSFSQLPLPHINTTHISTSSTHVQLRLDECQFIDIKETMLICTILNVAQTHISQNLSAKTQAIIARIPAGKVFLVSPTQNKRENLIHQMNPGMDNRKLKQISFSGWYL